MEKLSVIITAYDKHDLTVAHVKHSMDVSRIPDEIIVVNDHGDPSLKDMLKAIPDRKCPIVYAYITDDITWNYNGACNLAVWLSKGDYLAFEDNDNIPSYTFYEEAIAKHKEKRLARVQASKRVQVSHDDILNKKRDEFVQIGKWGPNMGTAVIPRDVYLDIKGQDERFCGQYGWMFYDFKSRLVKWAKDVEDYTASVGIYFYTNDGQSGLERPSSTTNYAVYRENARANRKQHLRGILNFAYEWERF